MIIIKTTNMFLAICQEVINTEGKVCVGWQLQNGEEQENCFHYYDTKDGVKGVLSQEGLDYVEIHRPIGKENEVLFM